MSKSKSRTLADFRAAHDRNVIVPNKIKAGLEDLEKEGGSENWEYEQEFIKRAGISQTDVNGFREQFDSYIVETGRAGSGRSKRIWFATVKAAKAAKGT